MRGHAPLNAHADYDFNPQRVNCHNGQSSGFPKACFGQGVSSAGGARGLNIYGDPRSGILVELAVRTEVTLVSAVCASRVQRRRRLRDFEIVRVGPRGRGTGNRSAVAPSYWMIQEGSGRKVERAEFESFVRMRGA
jgi:hypothetical protein